MAVDPARAKSLFLNASDLADPAERAAYLGRECGDDAALRNRVEALLRANEGSPEPPADLDVGQCGAQATGVHTPSPDLDASPKSITALYDQNPGAEILIAGRYTLQEKIGEGGMGEVWVAKQSEPVKRKVALKLIKPGMDSRAVLARFEQERQALAMMDHPNIAKVLDAGMTPNGQPFFVMELVNGLALNKFCDEARLKTNERLALFATICQAVQHAHQKGIVHRDLKPANILVTIIDGKPVPKVIDFGVAKATGGKLTDESMSTMFGSVVGTLEYMSPEQAGYSGMDVDTRADIYSLGVILYELLTGLRPIDATRLKKAALTEMIRIIQEEEPSKPSTRLSTDESLPSMAALRQIEPRKLMALLRGDLDWVVMKCLEKHRERRYETANALSRDVQRYLDGEAVEACPPSVGYRFGKFVKRHKGQVIAASLLLFVLLAGMFGTTWGLIRAERSAETERQAKLDAREQARIAAGERQKAETARQEAQLRADGERAARKQAVVVLKDITGYVRQRNWTRFESWPGVSVTGDDVQELMDIPLKPQERELLTKLLIYYENAARELASTADDPAELIAAYHEIGRIHKMFRNYSAAEAAFRALLAVDAGSGTAHIELAQTLKAIGRYDEAAVQWDYALRLALSADRDKSFDRLSRAAALARAGRFAEAKAEVDVVLAGPGVGSLLCYDAACVYAQAAAAGGPGVRTHADRAMDLLRRADENGLATSTRPTVLVAHIKFDPDLDPLRGRSDFQQFAASMVLKIIESHYREQDLYPADVIEPLAQEALSVSAADAEAALRRCLHVRLKKSADSWEAANTQSLLGAALSGQKKYAEAELLLLTGYKRMKQREKAIPAQSATRIPDALDRLIELYTATNKPEEATKWRAERTKYPATAPELPKRK